VLGLAVASALAFLVLAVLAFNQHFFDLDHSAHDLVRAGLYPELRPLMQALSRIGSGYVLVPLAAVGYLALRRLGHRLARYLPCDARRRLRLLRARQVDDRRAASRSSHRTAFRAPTRSARSYSSARSFTRCGRSRCARSGAGRGTVLMLLLIAGVAVSRLYLRSHWLSDVLEASRAGARTCCFFLLAADPRLRPQR
jgi:membrane-associated phospholipid phosphatase